MGDVGMGHVVNCKGPLVKSQNSEIVGNVRMNILMNIHHIPSFFW